MRRVDVYAGQDTTLPVVVFGAEGLSQLAAYVLTHDSPFRVAGHTVDKAYLDSARANPALGDAPVLPFEELERYMGPDECQLLIPVGHRDINGFRATRFGEAKARGYRLVSYVSSMCTIWPNVALGENVMVYERTVVQPFVRIGSNCVIRSSVHLSHHSVVEDHVFIAAGVVTGGHVTIGERSFVGLGATLRDGITLAQRNFIGAGSLVLANTEFNGLYLGRPARLQTKGADQV